MLITGGRADSNEKPGAKIFGADLNPKVPGFFDLPSSESR
jgi:hypothetical protein